MIQRAAVQLFAMYYLWCIVLLYYVCYSTLTPSKHIHMCFESTLTDDSFYEYIVHLYIFTTIRNLNYSLAFRAIRAQFRNCVLI